jgi:transposase
MPAQWKYPEELRERAVKMVMNSGSGRAMGGERSPGWAVSWVFTPSRCGRGSGSEMDGGQRPGTTTPDSQRIAELEKINGAAAGGAEAGAFSSPAAAALTA